MASAPGMVSNPIEAATIRKLRIRLLPFLFVLYVIAFLDRINIGFAALTMNRELAITSQQFGFVAGIFFFGYFLFEVPSNLLLHRIGARIWIARILISWGTIALCTGFVHTVYQLYVARFLLGVAEAGFFPGIVLYFTYWFRQRDLAHSISLLTAGMAVANIVGSPISGLILDHIHWWHVSSWRWLLILEGLPAVFGGLLTYLLLPSRPSEAQFLTDQEKRWIGTELEREELQKREVVQLSAFHGLRNRRVWHLASTGFAHAVGSYPVFFWLPQLMKSLLTSQSNIVIGALLMVPYLAGLVAMILYSRHSDRTLERRYHVAGATLIAGMALIALPSRHSLALSIALLSIAIVGIVSALPPFFALPAEFLTGLSAASGIALITSVANLGGFAGPYIVGWVRQTTGNLNAGLTVAGFSFFVAATLALLLPRTEQLRIGTDPGENCARRSRNELVGT